MEIFVGRALAAFAHPYAAWRVGSLATRFGVVSAYFAAGYVGVFAVLEYLPAALR
jgi:hypothetical protein